MKNERIIRHLAPVALLGLLSSFGVAAAAPDTPAIPAGEKAGKITALLPTAHIVRGEGKNAATSDAARGADIVWQDLVKTDKGGRARITLNDQSILSLGSQAELRIVKHDARAQQTSLEMTYGRIRAQVSTVTRDGGSFKLRTPTAVAGVIGTDFGTDASEPGVTTFLCISGLVQVSNSDPAVSGSVPCAAGQTTTVKSGLPPTPPQPATQQQITQLLIDTEAATISTFAPPSSLVGATVDAVATGSHMNGINGVTIDGAGVQVSLGQNASATSVTAHLVVAPTAEPGLRTVTFTKPNGANTAAMFTVIAPSALQGTDAASLKKRYTEILTAELQAADTSNVSIKASLQQDADQGLQTLLQENAKLPKPVSTDQIAQQLATLITNFNSSGANQQTQALNSANNAIDQIVAAIVPKIQDGSEPTANIAGDLDKQFAPINDAFQAALNQVHSDFLQLAANQTQAIDQLIVNFTQTINIAAQQQMAPPSPKVDSQERTLEAGFPTSFDAAGSSALGGASIVSTSWVLCDASYKPAQVGVVLPGNAPGCKPVPGFASTGSQFQLNTCTLNPATYVARVTVSDTNGKSSAMDVRLTVTAPAYDDPQTRLQSLAAAYVALQSQQFLSFFDPTFSGYTQLQENIRNTFLNLSSMQINLRVSQSSIDCNQATLRADWDQNYTFRGDQTCANAAAGSGCQKTVFKQSEQLTARMTRVPGKGWFVSDFQGDNGTVQGVAPGPQTTFNAQPSLQVTDLQVASSSGGTAQPAQQRGLRVQRATTVPVVGLPTGVNNFVATVQNVGDAPLTQQPQLHFSLLDADGNEIAGDTEDLPTLPLNPGDSEIVKGSFTVPALPASTPVNVAANVNPGCKIQEATCGGKNVSFISAVAGAPPTAAYVIGPITSTTSPNPPTGLNAFNVGQTLNLQFTITNTGTGSPTGNIVVGFTCTGPSQCAGLPNSTVAAPAAGQSVIASVPSVNLQFPPGVGYAETAAITSAPAQSSTAANSAKLTFDVTDFTLTNTAPVNGSLNVKIGGQGLFRVSLTEPQGLPTFSLPVTATPVLTGVNYAVLSSFPAGSSNPVVITASANAPAGTSALVTIAGTRLGVTHAATQSVRFFTASLDNFSPGQPGSSQTQPIILPVNGTTQSLDLKMSGNFFDPGTGVSLILPTVTGISITSPQTTITAGNTVTVKIQAVQGAALNQTIPLVFQAQVPNMNPPVPETLIVFVRPTALPDLAITSVTASGRDFNAHPLLSGEPVDFTVAVGNNGPGASQGFERLHLFLNGLELTKANVTVPQSIAANGSANVTVHVVFPDPVVSGAATLTAKVDEDSTGDANSSNDSLSVPVSTADWNLTVSGTGNSDSNAFVVGAGGSNTAVVQPTITGNGDFFTPVTVVNGIISSRITAAPSLTSFTSTQQPIQYTISAASNAAACPFGAAPIACYAAQVVARFVDGGHNTAQRQATIHISVSNDFPGDTVTVSSSRNNACASGCTPVEINGLLIENLNLTAARANGTTGSVDLHFTDQLSVISNVSATGSFQNPIINGVPYGVATNVYFAAAQDATGGVTPGAAQVTISATSIQTSAVRDGPIPDPVGPNQTTLQFSVGDLLLGSQPCFNVAPGASGTLSLTFSPLGGFNVPSITWNVVSLPPGVVLNSVTPSSGPSGGYPVDISLTNNNSADITPSQPLTLVGTISNNNGSATVAFAPAVQLHAGACVPGGTRNAMIEGGGISGNRGVWSRGTRAGAVARASIMRQAIAPAAADVRLIAGDVSFTPSMPKVGDTVQVRFRLTNGANADARSIQVALLVNGSAVASDTFDVGAGKTTLAGLQWNNAQLPRWGLATGAVSALLVVDPAQNGRASIASGKVAPLSHFEFVGGGVAGGAPIASLNGRQRALIELAEAACTGFRFSSGAGGACAASDVEISLEDAATGRFSFTSSRGISDMGLAYSANGVPPGTQYGLQAVAAAGHSYAVQLEGGHVGVLTISAIHNPHQKSAVANKVFRGGPRRVIRKIAQGGEPAETGDVSGTAPAPDAVVLDVLYDTP